MRQPLGPRGETRYVLEMLSQMPANPEGTPRLLSAHAVGAFVHSTIPRRPLRTWRRRRSPRVPPVCPQHQPLSRLLAVLASRPSTAKRTKTIDYNYAEGSVVQGLRVPPLPSPAPTQHRVPAKLQLRRANRQPRRLRASRRRAASQPSLAGYAEPQSEMPRSISDLTTSPLPRPSVARPERLPSLFGSPRGRQI